MTLQTSTTGAQPSARASRWQLTAASVTGRAHEKSGLPNQDSVEVLEDTDAEVVAAVVSDGAGSALRSKEGSQLTARTMAAALLTLGRSGRLPEMDAQHLQDWALANIERLRQELRLLGEPLAQFHCTFVGMVLVPWGGWLLQLGDSAALVSRSAPGGDQGRVWFPPAATRLHAGSRGGYANETHFVTDADWSLHLTVERLAAELDTVLLMSDGAMDVAMSQGRVFDGFLPAVARSLYDTPDRADRDDALSTWLAHPQTYRNTGDDKTLVIALRQSAPARRALPAPSPLATPTLSSTPPSPPTSPSLQPSQPPRGPAQLPFSSLPPPPPMAPASTQLPPPPAFGERDRTVRGDLISGLMAFLLVAAGFVAASLVYYLSCLLQAPPSSPPPEAREAKRRPAVPPAASAAPTPPPTARRPTETREETAPRNNQPPTRDR